MGYNQKFVKIERVIDKVKRDFPVGFDFNIDDAIEWVGEAISLIGAYSAYENKNTDGNKSRGHKDPVIVENYRAKLPCDLYKLNAINIINIDCNGKIIADRSATVSSSIFMQVNPDATGAACGMSPSSDYGLPTELSTNSVGILPTTSYKVRNGYIYFDGMPTGLLNISYEAFITDDRGYPMIPDDDRYVKALAAYLKERIGFRLMMGDLLTERKYERLAKDWYYDVNQAYTGSLLQNIDDAEAFRNNFTRMVSDSSARESNYTHENGRIITKIHTN